MLRPSDHAHPCPSCGGCMPFEGPPSQVCRCGSDWGRDLNELIRLLDEVLSDPPPADSTVTALPALPPTGQDHKTEESVNAQDRPS